MPDSLSAPPSMYAGLPTIVPPPSVKVEPLPTVIPPKPTGASSSIVPPALSIDAPVSPDGAFSSE